MAEHNDLGTEAEDVAVAHLDALGYLILERNYRFRRLEVDVIAFTCGELVAVEVKARSGDGHGAPYQFVDKKRQRKLIRAMDHYVLNEERDEPVRFDILSLRRIHDRWHIQHIEDAFNPYNL